MADDVEKNNCECQYSAAVKQWGRRLRSWGTCLAMRHRNIASPLPALSVLVYASNAAAHARLPTCC